MKKNCHIKRSILIFLIIFSWLFSGWPQIGNFPPRVQKAHAATVPAIRAFGGIAAVASGGSANLTVTLPTHSADDIILLEVVIRSTDVTADVSGYTQIATVDRDSNARYYWFYKRDGGSESNPVVAKSGTAGDTYAVATTFSGAVATGNPWDVVGTPQTSTNDPFVLTSITTSSHYSLIVAAVTGEDNNNTVITTTGTYPAAYTESDAESATGDDGIATISRGAQTRAGATGDVSVDWATAAPVGAGGVLLALKPTDNSPTYLAAGAVAYNTTAITPAFPAGIQAGDILLLFLETSNQAITIDNENGGTWTEVSNSPQYLGTAGQTTATRLTVFWSRYNGTQTAPVTSDSGDHQLGRMIAVQGAIATGDPIDITSGGTDAVADTNGVIPGATTSVANTLVVAALATALPDASGTANFSAQANGDLLAVTERIDNTRTVGVGGGLMVATGRKATAGTYGDTTVTLAASSVKAMMSIAIKPPLSIVAAPTDVAATDGTYTDKVTVTWTKSTGATGYKVYEASNLLDTLGDVATYDDSAAPAPTITAGTASATDGTSAIHVSLSLSGQSANNGTSRTYKVVAFDANGDSADSATDTGYRGVGSLTYQWQRSAADSDASYSDIGGATSDTYDDTAAPADGSGRYYKCVLDATGAPQQTTATDRGYKQIISITLEPGSGTVTYGTVETSKDTAGAENQTQTVRNTGNVAEDFDVRGANTASWTLSSSGPGDAIYKHEWCTATCDTTPSWNAFGTTYAGSYMGTDISPNSTQNFDLRISVPNSNAGTSQQSAAVYIQATQH